jgi:hypothetical protein
MSETGALPVSARVCWRCVERRAHCTMQLTRGVVHDVGHGCCMMGSMPLTRQAGKCQPLTVLGVIA